MGKIRQDTDMVDKTAPRREVMPVGGYDAENSRYFQVLINLRDMWRVSQGEAAYFSGPRCFALRFYGAGLIRRV